MTVSLRSAANDGAIQINGVDAVPFNAGGVTSKIQPISAFVATDALTISASALNLDFRSTTLGSGTVTTVSGTPANLVISPGSTLGLINAVKSRIAVLALNVAGTIELAASNLAGGVNLDETGLISTTAEGGAGAADSATVVYSTTARTNVAYRVIGYIESTQATAGTWATAPSTIQGYGGQALAAMSSLGYGQTWQDVTGSRVSGTTYYNTTSKPIMIAVQATNGAAGSSTIQVVVDGLNVLYQYIRDPNNGGSSASGTVIIPPLSSYSCTFTVSFQRWTELR
jgi:hypothetical protein